MPARAKICGLTEERHVAAAVEAGAAYLGFVFFGKSPRNLSTARAAALASGVPDGVRRVGLTVDADDAELDRIVAEVPLDMLQLHGSEPPARVAEVRERCALPVMKAIGVAEAADLAAVESYAGVADQLLLDAKPPEGAELPGGNGLAFNWRLLASRDWPLPWMLAGGLDAGNVAEAVRVSGAAQVDVSSGVESAPGRKDADRIRAFMEALSAA